MAKKKRYFFTTLVLIINQIAVLFLLLAYFASRVNPSTFWALSFVGIAYPLILIINILFVLYWLLRLRIYFMISALAILLGWGHVQNFIQINITNRPLPETGTSIRVLSYNVRVFDLYNYGLNWELNFTQRNNIFSFLEEKDFDIICFQEFVHDSGGKFKTLDTIPLFLRARHSHTGFSKSSRNINFFGLATFSAYPIVNKGEIAFESQMGNLCIYSDIDINGDTIRVYNVHFESIGLSEEDFLFVEGLASPENIANRDYLRHNSKRILQRMKSAYINRATQVALVAEHIRQSPYPVILAGDFNDTPVSWAYRQISRYLKDAFRSGRGIGQTYVDFLPGLRIDYIFHSTDFDAFNFQTGNHRYSDHYPIWVNLNLRSTY